MSKLPNAPLLEVIFELRWEVTNKADLSKYQYLHGDLYSILKDTYPFRESLVPPEIPSDVLINKPVHRFRTAPRDYPLFQIGPGLITLNTVDKRYEWNEYFEWCKNLIDAFFNVYPLDKAEKFTPSLIYFDFLKLDITKGDILTYINKHFNINVSQNFFNTKNFPKIFNWGLGYDTELGELSVKINVGKNGKQEEGLIIQTQLRGLKFDPESEHILNWLDNSHKFCSNLFKEMTKGALYESFKST